MQLTEVLLTEVGDVGDPGTRSTRPEWVSVAVYLRAEYAGDEYVAGGASTLPAGTSSPWNAPAVAQGLDEAVRAVAGAKLATEGDNLLAGVQEVVGQFAAAVSWRAATRSERTAVSCVAGALELALLDLLARARGVGLAELVGVRRPVPLRSAQGLQVPADVSVIRSKVAAQHGRHPVTRLRSRGRVEQDLQAVVAAEQVNVAAGGSMPLWLECDGRYSFEAAQHVLAELAEMLTDGRLSSTVYVEQPLPRSRREEMVALTRRPGELLVAGADHEGVPDLRVVLDESIETLEDLRHFIEHGVVTGISVSSRHGLDAALRIVEHAMDANPDVTVALCGVGQVTDLEAAAVAAVARVVPKLDLYLPGRASVELTRGSEDDADRSSGTRRENLPGAPPSLARVVARMGRSAWERLAPAPDPWESTVTHNEFDSFGLETFGKNSLDSYLLEREAHRLGLRTVRFRSVDFHVEDRDGRAIGFHCTTGPTTSRYIGKVCGDKQVARNLLARAGVSVPAGRAFDSADWTGALAFARSLSWPVVVKPASGQGGIGVTSNIRAEPDLKHAFSRLGRDGYQHIIVEKHIEGADYRFLVVGDRVASVVKRTAGGVVGDGRSSVAELVLAKNAARLRNPHLRTRLLVLGDRALDLLKKHGMTPDSVPGAGEHVVLTTAGNISRGGDSIEVLDETHPSMLEMAVRAVSAIPGLDHAGVDFLAHDHRRPIDEQDAAICELNSLPATTSHHFPAVGPPRNVSRVIMEHYTAAHGLVTAPRPDPLSVGLRITGQVRAVGYRQWFSSIAGQLGLSGWVRNSGEDLVEAEVTGPLDRVTALSLRAIFGPGQSRPELVETRPLGTVHTGEFVIHP